MFNDHAIAAALVLFVIAPHASAQCSPDAVTDVAYIEFVGCATAKLDERIDVTIGDEMLTAVKHDASSWRAKTVKKFKVRDPKLTATLGSARTACGVSATPDAKGRKCVARFRVQCEALWNLSVESEPRDAQTQFKYAREKPKAPPVRPCEEPSSESGSTKTPYEISQLAVSENVIVTLEDERGTVLEVPVRHRDLVSRGGTARLSDLKPRALNITAQPMNVAVTALKKAQVAQLVEMLFTTAKEAP